MHLTGEMLDRERAGPADPALWGLAGAVYGTTGIAHSVNECVGYLEAAGSTGVSAQDFIPSVLSHLRTPGESPSRIPARRDGRSAISSARTRPWGG